MIDDVGRGPHLELYGHTLLHFVAIAHYKHLMKA